MPDVTMQEQFQEVSLDLIPDIIAKLKDDPETLIHTQLLAMYQRCKTIIPERVIRLYVPNGVVDQYGTNLLFVPDHQYGLVFHSVDPNHDRLKRLLLGVKDIDWSLGPVVGPVHHCYYDMMQEILQEHNLTYKVDNTYGNFIIDLKEALALDTTVPEGTVLKPITLDLAGFINDKWPYKSPRSHKLIEDTIKTGGGYGLFEKSTGELLSWALHALVGGVGMLQTAEAHRGKGYATVIAKAVSKKVANGGTTPQVQIPTNQQFSMKLFANIRYKPSYRVDWHNIRGTMNR